MPEDTNRPVELSPSSQSEPDNDVQELPIDISMSKDGMVIRQEVTTPLTEELMNQIVINWLKSHPGLLLQIAAEAAAQEKQKRGGIITGIRRNRLN